MPASRQAPRVRTTRGYLGPLFRESGIRQATVRDFYVRGIQLARGWGEGWKESRVEPHVNCLDPALGVAILASSHGLASSLQTELPAPLTSLHTLKRLFWS